MHKSLSERRALLSQSRTFLSSSRPRLNSKPSIPTTNQITTSIRNARIILTKALLSTFPIFPPQSTPHWTICSLILPVPGDIRKMPPEKANAAIGLVLWFVSVLSGYLGVTLPFRVRWTTGSDAPGDMYTIGGGIFGVGTPWIAARSGISADESSGSWARWSEPHPLYLSSSPAPAPASESMVAIAANHTTALAMLCFNISYLAYTQSVSIPLVSSGDILANLYSICVNGDSGRLVSSHLSCSGMLTTTVKDDHLQNQIFYLHSLSTLAKSCKQRQLDRGQEQE